MPSIQYEHLIMQEYTLLVPVTLSDETALVLKNRPSFLAGKWNFIGGKVEEGEDPAVAALREYAEETGVNIILAPAKGYTKFATIEGTGYRVHVFAIIADYMEVNGVKTMTDEFVKAFPISEVMRMAVKDPAWLDADLIYLLSMARVALSGSKISAVIIR
jgi:8-oxo-dGTP pyrophosphatase MutT (NUDIX family)